MNFVNKFLSLKLLIGVAGLMVLVSLFYMPFSFHMIQEKSQHRLQERLNNTTSLMVSILKSPVWDFDIPVLTNNMEGLMYDPNLMKVSVYINNDRHLLTAYRLQDGAVVSSRAVVNKEYPDTVSRQQKIFNRGEQIAYVSFAYSKTTLEEEEIQAITQYVLTTVLLFLVLFGGLLFLFRKLVLMRLQHVNSVMMVVSNGDYEQSIDEYGEDEIGQLCHSFERMRISIREKINDIHGKNKELEALNTDLEKLVQERTQSLQERSEELEKEVRERANVEERMRDMLQVQEEISNNLLETSTELDKHRREMEQKNTILMASNRKLEDLHQTYEALLKKLAGMYENHLPKLQEYIKPLHDVVDGGHQRNLQMIGRELSQIQDQLRPIASLYENEKVIKSKRVLLAESDKQQQIVARLALRGTGVELDIVSKLEDGRQLLNAGSYDVICTNREMVELVGMAKNMYPNTAAVFLTSENVSNNLELLKQYPFLANMVFQDVDDRAFTLKNIMTTVSKLLSKDMFGLEKYMTWGVDVQRHVIADSEQRRHMVEEMNDYFMPFGFRKTLLTRCSMVTEELLMNAIYDAPTDSNGKSLYNHLPRTSRVLLPEDEQGMLSYACDGILLGVSVQDPFGAFSRKTILQYLEHCYSGKSGKLHKEKGGGGFGLLQIMETSDLVVFNVNPGIKTEVIALFSLNETAGKGSKSTTFHYFSL